MNSSRVVIAQALLTVGYIIWIGSECFSCVTLEEPNGLVTRFQANTLERIEESLKLDVYATANFHDTSSAIDNYLDQRVRIGHIDDPVDSDAKKKVFLKSRVFMPIAGGASNLHISSLSERPHLFIQFHHLPTTQERQDLKSFDVNLHSYLRYNTWITSIDKTKISIIKTLPYVRWVGSILPEDKIAPEIKAKVPEHATNSDGTVNLIAVFHKDVSATDAESILTHLGVISYEGPFMLNDWVVTISEDTISSLVGEDLVQWIEAVPPTEKHLNDGARIAVNADAVQAPPYNLAGNGVRVGMWELYNPDTTHDDLENRIAIVENVGTDEHPTHVAGTLGGNGSLSSGKYRGIATNVTYYSYSTLEDDQEPEEHNEAINTYAIDLSQNAWQTTTLGDYTVRSHKYDNIVKGVYGRRIPIIFAAGNYQLETPTGFNTVAAPGATAKNTISVGATKSNDDSIVTEITWGTSFGPTDDGRIKPDIMAPGCEKIFVDSFPNRSIWSVVSPDTHYGKCGTSMASAVVSGTIALMAEQFDKIEHNLLPLPSTFKAILLHTAVDIHAPGPDFMSGYGRIDTTAAIDLIIDAGPNTIIIEDSVSTDEVDNYTVNIPPGIAELKVTLVWDDEPGTPGSLNALVNDLDLILIDPCNMSHYPWLLDHNNPGIAATTGIDRLNNVEQVYISSPLNGIWQINVTGHSTPSPVQDYSLVYQIEDGDGIADWEDNCPWEYNPDQNDFDMDGIGDICECYAANINRVDPVNLEDFAILSSDWLLSCPGLQGDTNRDERVDVWDLAQIAQHWLSYCNKP